MWIAFVSILLQACYNQEVMRYTLYCGEPILTGCFRIRPGPSFWTCAYLLFDFGAIWPYLSANAAVPLTTAFLGHIPGAEVDLAGHAILPATRASELAIKQWVSYGIFCTAFLPLIFGGKIYNALEKVMTVKLVLVLGYLTFIGVFYVAPETWYRVFSGFIGSPGVRDGSLSLQWLPVMESGYHLDYALLASLAAIAGVGGMGNSTFSVYCRDKGWGMGSQVGALPSAVGGITVKLSHVGKVFRVTDTNLDRWRGWLRVIHRDQWGIWVFGCVLGMAIPSLVSLQFIPALGRPVTGDELSAVTAQLIANHTGLHLFWWLTLLCGFLALAPTQTVAIDGVIRRWTDIIWTGIPTMHRFDGHQVKYVYYGLLGVYWMFGLQVLICFPNPLAMVKVASIIFNYALGFSALHTLVVNCTLLPPALRPRWGMRIALGCTALFFTVVAGIATVQHLNR